MFNFLPLGLRLWRKNKAPLPGAKIALGLEPVILYQDPWDNIGAMDRTVGKELLKMKFLGALGGKQPGRIGPRQQFSPLCHRKGYSLSANAAGALRRKRRVSLARMTGLFERFGHLLPLSAPGKRPPSGSGRL